MINCIIIGAGQLGSRHLQGLLKLKERLQIHVVDPSEQSLETAKERANEIQHAHVLVFSKDFNSIPENHSLAIIATNANIRLSVAKNLLQKTKVNHLVLEKVLFQNILSYKDFAAFIKNYSCKVWVNHPRRMLRHYQKIKETLGDAQGGITYQAYGANWGLACNALHFIDLFTYISGSEIKTIELNWVKEEIIPSKRPGFIEFSGTIKGELGNGDTFTIACTEDQPSPVTLTIFNSENRFVIQEGVTPHIIKLAKENGFKGDAEAFIPEFQSTLTTRFSDDLLSSNSCDLPSYEDASQCHILFINEFLAMYNRIKNSNEETLPIT